MRSGGVFSRQTPGRGTGLRRTATARGPPGVGDLPGSLRTPPAAEGEPRPRPPPRPPQPRARSTALGCPRPAERGAPGPSGPLRPPPAPPARPFLPPAALRAPWSGPGLLIPARGPQGLPEAEPWGQGSVGGGRCPSPRGRLGSHSALHSDWKEIIAVPQRASHSSQPQGNLFACTLCPRSWGAGGHRTAPRVPRCCRGAVSWVWLGSPATCGAPQVFISQNLVCAKCGKRRAAHGWGERQR